MARVNILEWIAKKLRSLTGIVEDGDTATHAISAGKYVIWKGNPCKASSAISIGDALSSSNLTALTDGVCNDLADETGAKVNKTDIVDNLTTNDATKVLSAAQGYALNSNITNHATANHYDTITGGEVLSHGDIRIINMLDSNATIPTTGVKLIDKANYQNIRSMCKYFNGSADTTGFLKIETSGNDTYLYVTNLSGSKVSATYVSGSLVYTASSYNG